jgi:type VI secretion system protein ImpL
LAEVQGFQDASPILTKLLDQFHQLGLYPSEQALSQLTTTQAGSLLRQVDQLFGAQSLYTPVGGTFDRWNGQNTPARGGFDVHNLDEMAQYLQFQRQELQQYAAEAAPLESFLEVRLPTGRREPEGLVGKWKKIIADLQKYDAKMPGSSLAGLEDFVSVEMDKVTPDNCQSSVLAASASPGSDYFVQRREFLRRALATRCYYLSQQNAVRQYARIADLFNQRISGRFPFSPAPSEQLPSEADPQDVAELYRLLDTYSKSIHSGLQNGNFGSAHSQVLGFLNQMDALRPLFASLFTGEPSAVPMFDFVPVFRVNQGREIKGNHIIDWTLQVGTDTFRYREPERVGRWSFGQPVKLVLRWAKDSPDRPVPVKGASDARATSSRSVSYEFRDSWALLNMVVRHEAAPTDFDRMVDPEPQTLAFTVAGTEQDPEAKVFIRVKLRPPGKPENLRLRGFPTEAPSLSDDQMRTAEGGSQ